MFTQVFARNYDSVRRFAQRILGADAGEEIAAQTFLVAFSRREGYDPSYPSARGWLIGIANNLVRHWLRSVQVRRAGLEKLPYEREIVDVVDAERLDAIRMRPVLAEALSSISAEQRDVFLLVALGDCTYEETAHILELPVGTVRSRIHRARIVMRELLERSGAITGVDSMGPLP